MTEVTFHDLVQHVGKVNPHMLAILALDPGETTGYAWFNNTDLVESGQLGTGLIPLGVVELTALFEKCRPDVIVCEEYRVYQWRAQHHAGSTLFTARLIGVIECLAYQLGIPVIKQSAQNAKQFCTDNKLKTWGFWIKSQKHARDAIRHATYYLIFGPPGSQKESKSGKVG